MTSIVGAVVLSVSAGGCRNGLRTLQFDDASIGESIEYRWDHPDEPYLEELLQVCEEQGYRDQSDRDYEILLGLTRWVHDLWKHDGSNTPENNDPVSIIQTAVDGERYRCVEYASVLRACLIAKGIRSRVLWLTTSDVETRRSGAGHMVVEAYLPSLDRWVFSDPQYGVIPWMHDRPLNAVELQQHLIEEPASLHLDGSDQRKSYLNWIGPYLYYFAFVTDCRVNPRIRLGEQVMLVAKGAEPPKVFQRGSPIRARPIRSLRVFYQPPTAWPPAREEMRVRGSPPHPVEKGIEFSLYYPGAKAVALAGSFNDWNSEILKMNKVGKSGIWTATIGLAPGRHEYKFVVNGSFWLEDVTNSEAVPDGHQGRNSVVRVE